MGVPGDRSAGCSRGRREQGRWFFPGETSMLAPHDSTHGIAGTYGKRLSKLGGDVSRGRRQGCAHAMPPWKTAWSMHAIESAGGTLVCVGVSDTKHGVSARGAQGGRGSGLQCDSGCRGLSSRDVQLREPRFRHSRRRAHESMQMTDKAAGLQRSGMRVCSSRCHHGHPHAPGLRQHTAKQAGCGALAALNC